MGRAGRAGAARLCGLVLALHGCSGGPETGVRGPSLLPDHPPILDAAPQPITAEVAGARWEAGRVIPLERVGLVVSARTAGTDSVLVVDGPACQAVLFRLVGDVPEYLSRHGRCGDGPGEFRSPVDALLLGDSVLIADHDRNTLTLIPRNGGPPRVLSLPHSHEDPWRIAEVIGADESQVLATGTSQQAGPGLLRVISRHDGSFVRRMLPEPLLRPGERLPVGGRVFACQDALTGFVGVGSRWMLESAVIDVEGTMVLGPFVSDVAWAEAVDDPLRGARVPSMTVRLACGEGRVLIVWRERVSGGSGRRYLLEVIDLGTGERYREHGVGPMVDHPSAMEPIGANGEGWLFYSNDTDLGPVVRSFFLLRSASDQVSAP